MRLSFSLLLCAAALSGCVPMALVTIVRRRLIVEGNR